MTIDDRPESGVDFNRLAVIYKARVTKLLGDPRARKEDIPPEFLEEYDRIHQDNPEKDPKEVLAMVEGLDSIDGHMPSITIPDGSIGNYIQGVRNVLWRSLERDPNDSTKRLPKLVASRTETIAKLAEDMSGKVLIDGGYPNEDAALWISRNEFVPPSHLTGQIAAREWLLGLRPDLGVDVQAEIDRFPNHPLRTKVPAEENQPPGIIPHG